MKKLLFITATIFILATSAQAQKKISELPVATSLSGTDKMVIVNSGATKQMSASVLLNVVHDTAYILRAYVDDQIANQAITGTQIVNNTIGMDDIAMGATSSIFMTDGPKTKTTTSAGDTLISKVEYPYLPEDVIIYVRAVFVGGASGGGVGKFILHKADGSTHKEVATGTLDSYTYGYLEASIKIISVSKIEYHIKSWTFNDYTDTFTVTNDTYHQYNNTSSGDWGDLSIYYNSTIIGFKCLNWEGEVKRLDNAYSGWYTNY